MKPQRIAIIHDKQQYGEGLARSVQESLKAGKANIVFFDGITAGEKDFSALIARLKKKISILFITAATTRKWDKCCASTPVGLNTQFMGPEGVGNASLSNIAGDAAEGMLVTMPKRYDQIRRIKLSSMRSKLTRKIQPVRTCGSLMQPSSHWRQQWIAAVAKSRWSW